MSAINNLWGSGGSGGTTATEEMLKQQYQNTIASAGIAHQGNPYRNDGWGAPVARTRFSVYKVENGYILESGDTTYIADTIEQVQGIVATLLIAKAG